MILDENIQVIVKSLLSVGLITTIFFKKKFVKIYVKFVFMCKKK